MTFILVPTLLRGNAGWRVRLEIPVIVSEAKQYLSAVTNVRCHSRLDWVIGLPLFTSGGQHPESVNQVILPYVIPAKAGIQGFEKKNAQPIERIFCSVHLP